MSETFSLHTPKQLGYSMPAEWAPQSSLWLIWPHDSAIWPADYEGVTWNFAHFIAAVSEVQPVDLIIENRDVAEAARIGVQRHGGRLDRVHLHEIPTNDVWMRDCGPIFVTSSQPNQAPLAMVGWRYNAWGGKFPYDKDDQIPRVLGPLLGLPLFEPEMILEGGSIEVNGAGTVLTTEQCLLHENRNPSLSREQIEEAVLDYFGAEQVIWLPAGLDGDDTDGHIDDLARFCAENTVVAVVEKDRADSNYDVLTTNEQLLRSSQDRHGRPFRVETLPQPARMEDDGRRLPCSYANFLIINDRVLLPTFGCPQDHVAQETLRRLFPGRQVVGIDSRHFIFGGGALHCLSQQQPAVA